MMEAMETSSLPCCRHQRYSGNVRRLCLTSLAGKRAESSSSATMRRIAWNPWLQSATNCLNVSNKSGAGPSARGQKATIKNDPSVVAAVSYARIEELSLMSLAPLFSTPMTPSPGKMPNVPQQQRRSSSSLSSEEEMGSNVPPSSHGTTTTTKKATAATIATTIAAATERNVDRRGCLDRTTPSTTRYGDASVPPFSSTIDDARQDGVLRRDGWSSDGRTTAASSS